MDFVFIDASHEADMVYLDCEAWWPKVKVGGVLAGHDYDPFNTNNTVYPGVKRYFDDKRDQFKSQEGAVGLLETRHCGCLWMRKIK